MEKTLVLLKPDALRRGKIGPVLSRFEEAGLKIAAMKMVQTDLELAGKHYTYEDIALRHGEDVRNRLMKFICSAPVVALIIEGISAIEVVRKICGDTEPRKALPGTIRGDFCHHSYARCSEKEQSIRNMVHASANKEDAERELALWFEDSEILNYSRNDEAEHFF